MVRRPTTTQWCACICASRSQGPDLSLIINLLAVAEVHACMHGNYVLLATVFTSRDQRTRDTAGRRASTVKVRRHACTQSLVLTCVPHITFSRSRAGRCMSARRLLRPLCHCIVHGCCLRAPGSSCGPALCLSVCLPRARACVMRGQMASRRRDGDAGGRRGEDRGPAGLASRQMQRVHACTPRARGI